MANRALPASVHKLNGTYQPCRHSEREEGRLELGDVYPECPDYIAQDHIAVQIWEDLRTIMEPSGLYTEADTSKIARYCMLEAEFRVKLDSFPTAKLQAIRLLERDLYLCPESRAKIGVKQKQEDNPFEKFK
jgi:phage terminase small subunit